MTHVDDQLRHALGVLDHRERETLARNVRRLADKTEPTRPKLAAVWSALAEVVEDIARLQRARLAAQANQSDHPMAYATRGRR